MKNTKFALIIGLILSIASGLQAQDTLSADTLKSTYYCTEWFDFVSTDCILMNTGNYLSNTLKVDGKLIELDDNDTITIYGIAVGADSFTLPLRNDTVYSPDGQHVIYTFVDSSYYYQELNSMCDTSAYAEAYELFGIYKRDADSLKRVSPQLPLNIKLHEPSYIITFSTYEDGSCTKHTKPLNVYELFFHNPIEMSGPFYLAMTNRIKAMGSEECKKSYYTWPVFRRALLPSGIHLVTAGRAWFMAAEINWGVEYPAHWVFQQISVNTFEFPIIAPPDSGYVWDTTVLAGDTVVVATGDTIIFNSGDTIVVNGDTTIIANGDTVFVAGGSAIVCETSVITDTVILLDTAIVGGDTIVFFDTIVNYDTTVNYDILLSISEVNLADRLTLVKPNPAAETVKVVSSIGMNHLEVFNIAGTQVLNRKITSGELSYTIDVSLWPIGTYIIHIHTPHGVVTKKLVVRR